jgi:sulfide:quinone oxidoreductase
MARVLILGGGVGGSIVANRLVRKLRASEAQITVIDPSDHHVCQPGLLYLPLNKRDPKSITRPIRRLLDKRVELIEGTVDSIDVSARSVSVGGESSSYDWLVLATGCQLRPERVPGSDNAYHFYDLAHSVRLREALANFKGGRIVVGRGGTKLKCPVAPLEFMLLLNDHLRRQRLRDRTELHFFTPQPALFGANSVAQIMNQRFLESGIGSSLNFNLKEINESTLHSQDDESLAFDLAVVVPPHGIAPAISEAGFTTSGWVPTDQYTLKVTEQENVFALGDVTDLNRPKTGATAHYQAQTVVDGLIAGIRRRGHVRPYDGSALCFIETGNGSAAKMSFAYDRSGRASQPSRFYHWIKSVLHRLYWIAVPSGRL